MESINRQESGKRLKGMLIVSSKTSAAQGQVEKHNTYFSSGFKSYFFLIFVTLI